MINESSLKKISALCALMVPLLVTGPFLGDLLASLLSLWFIYYSLKNKMYFIFKNIYFYFFISFCLVSVTSSLLSDNIFFSLKSSLFYFRIGIFALLISYLIDQNKKILDYFYYALVLTFAALIIDGYYQYITGHSILGYKIYENGRISSFFGKELILGSYLCRLFPLLIALFLFRKNKNLLEIRLAFILFIGTYTLIFLSGERAAFILSSLSSLFIILFISRYKKLRILAFVFSLLIITLISSKDGKYYDRYSKSMTSVMSLGFTNEKKIFFTPAHSSLIRTAWKMFLDKPIFGHGPKLFRIKCADSDYAVGITPCNNHPHNFYIQLLAETGIIGFIFLAGLFFYFLYLITKHIIDKYFYKKEFLTDYQICLLGGLLITIWPLTTNGNFFSNHLMFFYALQIGFFKRI